MKEKLICIVTPQSRCYYRATPLAKEFLDKDHNLINTSGTIPDGEWDEYKISTKTTKQYQSGKLNGTLQIIDLNTNKVTFTEQYKNGILINLEDYQVPGTVLPSSPRAHSPKYNGTLLKSNKGTLSFYVNGKEVAEQTIGANGMVLEQLGEIPDGPVKELDDNGQVRLEAMYQKNQLEGRMIRYNEQGDITSEETYQRGQRQGPAQYYSYYAQDKTCICANYANGLLHGKWVARSALANGQAFIEAFYQQGKLQGERALFYQNGKLQCKETYENGKLQGERTLYFPQGQLWYQEHYKNGRLDGERLCFYPGGQKYLEEFYTEGLLEGPRKVFDEKGNVLLDEEYHWGTLLHNTERKALN